MYKPILWVGWGCVIYGVVTWILPFVYEEPLATPPPPPKKVVEHKKERLYAAIPKPGERMGTLFLPSLKAELPIYQGHYENELAKGVGHYDRSALPGELDNVVLGGHRDTVFRRLGELKKGDVIEVETTAGRFTYRVTSTEIVNKDDRTIIVSTYPKPKLTLVTCYPFGFIGPAPKRYIVHAELVESQVK